MVAGVSKPGQQAAGRVTGGPLVLL
jgi:hypothetical protein